jgi:uncharacterized HAD superfamily protein
MKIAVDVDGTICNTPRLILERFFERTGIKIPVSWIDTYNYELPDKGFNMNEEYLALWADGDGVLAKPYNTVHKWLSQLILDGHQIFIVTSRPAETAYITEQWLVRNRIYNSGLVTATDGKYRVGFVDMLIDDNPTEIELFASTGRPACLITRPWNAWYYYPAYKLCQVPGRKVYVAYPHWKQVYHAVRAVALGETQWIKNYTVDSKMAWREQERARLILRVAEKLNKGS